MSEINLESLQLYLPTIDDRGEEELYQDSLNVIANRSRGQLNDTSPHNPVGVILRSIAFASAELLYKVNKLPLALAVKLLELTGVKRRLGVKAQVSLTFSLTAPRTTPYTIPQGFQVVSSGGLSFFTESLLTIPAGAATGLVDAVAEKEGSDYNLPGYTINQITQPLAFLASVVNTEPSQGGAAAETIESTIERGLIALRSRNPVSAIDFEKAAEDIAGSGSKAKAIGLLGPDKITEQPGAVHLFLLSATGEPANPALISDVFRDLEKRIMLGTSLYINPMELEPIAGVITAKLIPGQDPNAVADALWKAYQDYLNPAAYNPGDSLLIQELAFNLRFVNGLDLIDELKLNGGFQSIPMPNAYTLPSAYSLSIELVDEKSNIFKVLRGAGEPVDAVLGED